MENSTPDVRKRKLLFEIREWIMEGILEDFEWGIHGGMPTIEDDTETIEHVRDAARAHVIKKREGKTKRMFMDIAAGLGGMFHDFLAEKAKEYSPTRQPDDPTNKAVNIICDGLTARRDLTNSLVKSGGYPHDDPHYRLDIVSVLPWFTRCLGGRSIASPCREELEPTKEEREALDVLGEAAIRWRVVYVIP